MTKKLRHWTLLRKQKSAEEKSQSNFKIGKTQAANVVKNQSCLRAEYDNFKEKALKTLEERNMRNKKQSAQFHEIILTIAKL